MTIINGIANLSPLSGPSAVSTDARGAAAGAMDKIGQRVLAWVGQVGGRGGDATATNEFKPDARELARGGDIYGLGDLSRSIAGRFGASPAQEGALTRSLEDFTRAAVVQLAGLSGAPADRQLAGVREATEAATQQTSDGVDGVIDRLDAATEILRARNSG